MYKNKKIVCFIPARSGSKGVPNKNIYPICGKPLIAYTIEHAQQSGFLDDIICSTDGPEIAQVAKKMGISIIKRPAELSADTSKTIDAVIHTIQELKKQGKVFDYILILQPTTPLRKPEYIDDIIRTVIDNDFPSMVSVHPVEYNPVLVRFQDGNHLTPILTQQSTVRRQDMKKASYVDGSLYIYKTNLLTLETSLNDSPFGYETESQYALDINNMDDINLCQKTLSEKTSTHTARPDSYFFINQCQINNKNRR